MDETGISHQALLAEVASLRARVTSLTAAMETGQRLLEASQRSEGRLRAAFETGREAALISDSSGRFVNVNRAAAVLTGYAETELSQMGLSDLKGPHGGSVKAFAEGLGAGEEKELRTELTTKDHHVVQVDVHIVAFEMNGASYKQLRFRDISAQLKRQEESVRLLRALDQTSEGVMLLAARGLTILFVNRAFERICGYTREEMVGRSLAPLWGELREDSCLRAIVEAVLEGGDRLEGIQLTRRYDAPIEFMATISPICDSEERVESYLIIAHDVTSEAQRSRQARRARKMLALGALARGVAHELNSSLGIIVANCELAIEDSGDNEQVCYSLDLVLKAADRATRLLKKVLILSRPAPADLKEIHIGPALADALKEVQAGLPSGIRTCHFLAMENDIVLADTDRVREVLLELCANAVYAMREAGGVLEVSSTPVHLDSPLATWYHEISPGPYLRLTVRDTGEGMDEDTIERIFDPFFSTRPAGPGVGLGLATVFGIVSSHRGGISVFSRAGQGSTFHVYLPRIEPEVDIDEEAFAAYPRGAETILLIDDDVGLIDDFRHLFDRLGYRTIAFANCREALARLRRSPRDFDLVALDHRLPHTTGFEVAQEIQKIRPQLPIVLFTGLNDVITLAAGRAIGIRAMLVKPVAPRLWAGTIRWVLGEPE